MKLHRLHTQKALLEKAVKLQIASAAESRGIGSSSLYSAYVCLLFIDIPLLLINCYLLPLYLFTTALFHWANRAEKQNAASCPLCRSRAEETHRDGDHGAWIG